MNKFKKSLKQTIIKSMLIIVTTGSVLSPISASADYIEDPNHELTRGMLELYKNNKITNPVFKNVKVIDTKGYDPYTPFSWQLNAYGSTVSTSTANGINKFVESPKQKNTYIYKENNPEMKNLLTTIDKKIEETYPNKCYKNYSTRVIADKMLSVLVNNVEYLMVDNEDKVGTKNLYNPDLIVSKKQGVCYHVSLAMSIALNKMGIPATQIVVTVLNPDGTVNKDADLHAAVLYYDDAYRDWRVIDPPAEYSTPDANGNRKLYYKTNYGKNNYSKEEYLAKNRLLGIDNITPMENGVIKQSDLDYILHYHENLKKNNK